MLRKKRVPCTPLSSSTARPSGISTEPGSASEDEIRRVGDDLAGQRIADKELDGSCPTPGSRGGSSMFQSKKLTPRPKTIGASVKPRNRSRLGPRKNRAHNQSRRCRLLPRCATAALGRVAATVDVDATVRSTPPALLLRLQILVEHALDVRHHVLRRRLVERDRGHTVGDGLAELDPSNRTAGAAGSCRTRTSRRRPRCCAAAAAGRARTRWCRSASAPARRRTRR